MSTNQNQLRIILIYSLATFLGLFFGMWGFRVIVQEVFYRIRYYHLFYGFLLCGVMTLAIIIGLFLVLATFGLLREQTNSYLPILIAIPAVLCAFQVPLQMTPEARHFFKNREDYGAIVNAWHQGLITEDSLIEPCISNYQTMIHRIADSEYCVLTGSWVGDEALIFFLYDDLNIILYTEYNSNSAYGHVCERIYPYGGELEEQIDMHWSVCRLYFR